MLRILWMGMDFTKCFGDTDWDRDGLRRSGRIDGKALELLPSSHIVYNFAYCVYHVHLLPGNHLYLAYINIFDQLATGVIIPFRTVT